MSILYCLLDPAYSPVQSFPKHLFPSQSIENNNGITKWDIVNKWKGEDIAPRQRITRG